jgi:hypothetical protein
MTLQEIHTHTHTHTLICWCYLWVIRVVEVTYHCLPALCPLWGPLVKFPEASWLRVDPVSLDIVYASTLGSLAAWTSTQWEIARECFYLQGLQRNDLAKVGLECGHLVIRFQHSMVHHPESEGISGGTCNWKSSSDKPSPRSSRMLHPHPQSTS